MNYNDFKGSSDEECPHCNNIGNFTRGKNAIEFLVNKEEIEINDTFYEMLEESDIFDVYKCNACEQYIVTKYFFNNLTDEDSDSYVPCEILYPHNKTISLPQGLKGRPLKEYQMASKYYLNNHVIYGVHIRRSMEAICTDKGIPKEEKNGGFKPLSQRLKLLQKKLNLPDDIILSLKKTSIFTNEATHGDKFGEDESRACENLFRVLVTYIYSLPEYLDRSKELIEKINS